MKSRAAPVCSADGNVFYLLLHQHSSNKVPCHIWDPEELEDAQRQSYRLISETTKQF